MPPQEKALLSARIIQDEEKRCREDLLYFLTKYVKSLDEHDTIDPIKPLPMDKQYLQDIAWLFINEKLLLIEKSRQMLVTWIITACCLWDAQFHEGRRIAIQSKKEQDANAILDRVKFIYRHEPDILKQAHRANEPMAYTRLEFGKQNSIIMAIPQGAEQLRQYTFSRVIVDEAAFQEQAEEGYIAMRPTLTGGGKLVMVSSPNFKNFFWRIRSDKI